MEILFNEEKGTFEGEKIVTINNKEFVIVLTSELKPNGRLLQYQWGINGQVYDINYLLMNEAKEKLKVQLESIEKVIIAAEKLDIPLVSGNFSLEYVNEAMIDKGVDFKNGVAKNLMDEFLSHHSLEELPKSSCSLGEVLIYYGIETTEAAETSLGMELIGTENEEVNFFYYKDDELSSVSSFNAQAKLSEVMKAFTVMVKDKAVNEVLS